MSDKQNYSLVFFVSPTKTCSKTYAYAFQELGWNSTHDAAKNNSAILRKEWEYFREGEFNAFFDGCANHFTTLDTVFPDAVFVCCLRTVEEIMFSHYRHAQAAQLNGVPVSDAWMKPGLMCDAIRDHYFRLLNYFKHPDRMHRFLMVKPEEGWKPLCEYFDLPEPEVEFPHKNKSSNLNNIMTKFEDPPPQWKTS